MRKRVIRSKPMVVDQKRYLAAVTAIYEEEVVELRVTVRADFGTHSVVIFRGLQNFDYFHHYGHRTADGISKNTDTIEITPRMIIALIHFARTNGWNPEIEKKNCEIDLTNVDAKATFAEYNADS